MTDTPTTSSCGCASKMSSSEPKPSDCTCSKRPEESKPDKNNYKDAKDDEFNPKPYTFRLQQVNEGPRVRSPPFHVQLDHVIAVLWHMYRQSSYDPDVDHLQWAKHFLQRIRNNHGDMPRDVEVIVKAIDDRILSLYADLSKKPHYKAPNFKCCSEEPEHCQAKQSITFTEMVKQKPEVAQQLFCDNLFTLTEPPCGSHPACDCGTSKEEMAKYLKQQRADRVRIIHAELKRLDELDRFMGNVQSDTGADLAITGGGKESRSSRVRSSIKSESAPSRRESAVSRRESSPGRNESTSSNTEATTEQEEPQRGSSESQRGSIIDI